MTENQVEGSGENGIIYRDVIVGFNKGKPIYGRHPFGQQRYSVHFDPPYNTTNRNQGEEFSVFSDLTERGKQETAYVLGEQYSSGISNRDRHKCHIDWLPSNSDNQ